VIPPLTTNPAAQVAQVRRFEHDGANLAGVALASPRIEEMGELLLPCQGYEPGREMGVPQDPPGVLCHTSQP
jgi:hypothetical protein